MFKSMIKVIPVLFFLCGFYTVSHAKEIVDMTGRQVTVPDKIETVFGTSPPATYLIYAMSPELVAGLNTPFDQVDTKYIDPRVLNLPVMGGWFGQGRTANVESMLKVSPDLVIMWQWANSRVMNEKIMEMIKPAGIPVVCVVLETLADYPAVFRFLGKLFGLKNRGERLAAYAENTLSQVSDVENRIPEHDRLTVYYAEGPDGFATECHSSMHALLIPLSGGVNVHKCQDGTMYGMQKISVEEILIYAPQVIVAHEPLFFEKYRKDPRWKNVRAVKEGRVYRIPREPFNWFDRPPSFMHLIGLKWLTNSLYPDKYPMDMVAETKRFYALFLNVALSDEDARKVLFR